MSGILQGILASIGGAAAPGQQAYTIPGTYSWVAPAGVTKVSVVAIGGGATRGAGGLGYKNNYAVTPGNSYTVIVGGNASGTNAGTSSFSSTAVVRGGGGSFGSFTGTYTGDGGGNGGYAASSFGGGGAGGYSGNGGNGAYGGCIGSTGAGGGGGGGAALFIANCFAAAASGGGGGGTGLLGQGSNGAGGTITGCVAGGGGGGSGGASGVVGYYCCPGVGGQYGGAGGYGYTCAPYYCISSEYHRSGQAGAVRIIWPGCARSFPSTRTADE